MLKKKKADSHVNLSESSFPPGEHACADVPTALAAAERRLEPLSPQSPARGGFEGWVLKDLH